MTKMLSNESVDAGPKDTGPNKKPKTTSPKTSCPECGALGAWDRSPWNLEQHLKRPICKKNRKSELHNNSIWIIQNGQHLNFSFPPNWDKKGVFNAFGKTGLGSDLGNIDRSKVIPIPALLSTPSFQSDLGLSPSPQTEFFIPSIPSMPAPPPLLSPDCLSTCSFSSSLSDETPMGSSYESNNIALIDEFFFTPCEEFAEVIKNSDNEGYGNGAINPKKRKRDDLRQGLLDQIAQLQESVRLLDGDKELEFYPLEQAIVC